MFRLINLRHIIFLLSLIGLSISCQEETFGLETSIPEYADPDMEDAINMADAYLNNTHSRNHKVSKSITVLKFKDGKLMYNTNISDEKAYNEVLEESITAIVQRGDYIFWYSGGGVIDLEAIEFSPDSQVQLKEMPMETNSNKMWMVIIRDDEGDDDEDDHEEDDHLLLKYDIVYKAKGIDGYIRLDPKIKVSQ